MENQKTYSYCGQIGREGKEGWVKKVKTGWEGKEDLGKKEKTG